MACCESWCNGIAVSQPDGGITMETSDKKKMMPSEEKVWQKYYPPSAKELLEKKGFYANLYESQFAVQE